MGDVFPGFQHLAVTLDRLDVPVALRSVRHVVFFPCLSTRTSVVNEYRLDRFHNLASVLLAIGSPALAGYSLAITRLNSRWLSHQFANLKFPNKVDLPQAVSALQHIPFKMNVSGPPLPSLIVLHENDKYWESLAEAAKRTRQWSIPTIMNIVWVLVAFIFTIVGSLIDFDAFIAIPGDAGYPVVAVWAYLLPLVVGWLHVGSQLEAGQLDRALNDANCTAFVAATGPVPAPAVKNAIEFSTEYIDHANADEKKTAPIFNYARVFIWSQHAEYIFTLYQYAARNAKEKFPVRPGEVWTSGKDDRIGNAEEVVRYCTKELEDTDNSNPSSLPFTALCIRRSSSKTLAPLSDTEATKAEAFVTPVFATEVFQRIFFAVILAHDLQWGTTGAAILIHIFTPPKGIGCRALTFILYGAAGTLTLWLLLLSSILGHWSRQTDKHPRSTAKLLIAYTAALARWLGKFIAIVNGFCILISCCMQFAGAYDNCFCSSTILGGDPDGLVKFLGPDVKGSQVYGYWIGGVTLSFGVSALYAFLIYVATPMSCT